MTYDDIAIILVERDDISYKDAMEIINETQYMINDAINDGEEYSIEEIMNENLGLEMDYIWPFL